jgi:hypothetical protein
MKIFISYNYKDREFSRHLAVALQSGGLATWIDDQELKIGDSLVERISEAIRQSDAIIIVLSKNTPNSQWQSSEIAMAVAAHKISSKRIIPIVLDKDTDIPFFIKDRLYLDLSEFKEFDEKVAKLAKVLQSIPPASSPESEQQAAIEKIQIEKELLVWEKKIFKQKSLLRTQLLLAAVAAILVAILAPFSLLTTKIIDVNLTFLKPTFPFLIGVASGVISTALAAYFTRKKKLNQKHNNGEGHNGS